MDREIRELLIERGYCGERWGNSASNVTALLAYYLLIDEELFQRQYQHNSYILATPITRNTQFYY